MSICQCAKCQDLIDTDFHLETVDGKSVCDACYQTLSAEKQTKVHSKKVFSDDKQAFYLGKQGVK